MCSLFSTYYTFSKETKWFGIAFILNIILSKNCFLNGNHVWPTLHTGRFDSNLNFYINADPGSTLVSNIPQNSVKLCTHRPSQILPPGPHFVIRLFAMTRDSYGPFFVQKLFFVNQIKDGHKVHWKSDHLITICI